MPTPIPHPTTRRTGRHGLPAVLALLVALMGAWGQAQTDAGTVVTNVAHATFARSGSPSSTLSNVVRSVVGDVCGIEITPDGTVASPSRTVVASPGEAVVLAYLLRSRANAAADVELAVVIEAESGLVPLALALHLDVDGDGLLGPGDTAVTALPGVPPGASIALLLVVTFAFDTQAGSVYLDVTGRCAGSPATADRGNVARVIVERHASRGIESLLKGAVPVSGTPVHPGADVRYTLSFTSTRALTDVVVRDPLDPLLEPPTGVTTGTVTDTASGLSAFATVSFVDGALVWLLPSVPAGMTVTLDVVTSVRRDAPVGAVVRNAAHVRHGGGDTLDSATTLHPVEALALRLAKASEPEQARPGERLAYRLVASNPSAEIALPETELVDELPSGVRYLHGTATAALADGRSISLEPDVAGQTLRWTLPPLLPGERHEVRFEVEVLELLPAGLTLVNHARLSVLDLDGRALSVSAASVATLVLPGMLSPRSVLLGTAFVDVDRDGRYDAAVDLPLAGLRLYLADGRSTVTDGSGRYTFPDLAPGVAALKLDALTVPPRLLDRTPTEAADGLWRVRLHPGTITRQDIPFGPPEASLAVRAVLTVTRGPVTLVKRASEGDDGRIWVTLTLTTRAGLRGVVVEDALPAGVPMPVGGPPRFLLGDVAAGETIERRYPLSASALATELPLPPPRILWETRP
jgi:uncharacterized repeat protein (TIGR01451 family)